MQSLTWERGHVLFVSVPRSSYPPHQVTSQQNYRVYIRRPTQVSPANMTELRALFDETGNAYRRAEEFRAQRILEIIQGSAALQLANRSSQCVLHVQPLSAPRPFEVRADMKQAMQQNALLRPLGLVSGWTPRFNADGFACTAGGASNLEAYVQVFRTGELEAVASEPIVDWKNRRTLTARHIEHWIAEALPNYLTCLESVGVAAPFVVSVTILGAKDSVVATDQEPRSFHGPAHLTVDTLKLPSVLFEDTPLNAPQAAAGLKPALDALWNAAGFPEWLPLERR